MARYLNKMSVRHESDAFYILDDGLTKSKVRFLQYSSRPFRHDAIVKHVPSGKIETVPARCLREVDADGLR